MEWRSLNYAVGSHPRVSVEAIKKRLDGSAEWAVTQASQEPPRFRRSQRAHLHCTGDAMQNLLAKIFFLDTPSLIDSAWRHIDFRANAERHYVPGAPGHIEPRPLWMMPPFWTFAILVFFVSYGPNWSGLCATAPESLVKFARWALGLVIAGGALFFAYKFRKQPSDLATRRFDRLSRIGERVTPFRKRVVTFGAQMTALVVLVLALKTAGYVAGLGSDPVTCVVEGGSLRAFLRFALCSGAVVGIAALASRLTSTTLQRVAEKRYPATKPLNRLAFVSSGAAWPLMESLHRKVGFRIDRIRDHTLGTGKIRSGWMRRFLPDGAVAPLNVRTSDHGFDGEPLSPANVLARFGVLLLVALCFGLAARLLVGAP
jgi:hypothetical protein